MVAMDALHTNLGQLSATEHSNQQEVKSLPYIQTFA
jgi:hypothetical protein